MMARHKFFAPLVLFALALVVNIAVAARQPHPANMDEAYHTVNAMSLATGCDLTESFIWNYLSPPETVTHAANLYWMPLTGFIAAAGMVIGGATYSAGQAGFVLLASLLPALGFGLAWQVSGKRRFAWLTGWLMVFSGFFMPVWTVIDTFTPFALAGAIALFAAWKLHDTARLRWAWLAGLSAGLAHLTRADGLLLLAVGLLVAGWMALRGPSWPDKRRAVWAGLALLAGYGLVMLPWFARNWATVGAILPPGGGKTMWLTAYNDIFSYGKPLSWQSYAAWGWGPILRSKGQAAWWNFQTLLAVPGMIFLFPLAIIGWWQQRHRAVFVIFGLYLAMLWLAMTVVFTFPGPRGALFHSSGAILPFMIVAALYGLDAALAWLARRRSGWRLRPAQAIFGGALVVFGAGIGLFAMTSHASQIPASYPDVVRLAGQNATVMIGNPPAYVYFGGKAAIALPNNDLDTALAVADRYGASFLAVDANHPAPFDDLFAGRASHPRLRLAAELPGPLYLYRIESQ